MQAHQAPPAKRPVRSYVLRGGRMGSGQVRALEQLAPRYVLAFQTQLMDWSQVFSRHSDLVLEIGFGMGAATAQMATVEPHLDLIGLEVHEAGVGALLQHIEAQGLANLRIVRHDAIEVLQHMIAPASLHAMRVYFPDPWPKKRHHKRRIINPANVALMASRLAPGGLLHCATDWQPYAQQMLQVLGHEPLLANTANGYAPRPAARPMTKFEARGLQLGHGVWDLVFQRR